jgi:hypothetical protein
MQKWYPCYLIQVTADLRSRQIAIQLYKNCIKQKQSQKIMKLFHMWRL